jgi:hypothetical protein
MPGQALKRSSGARAGAAGTILVRSGLFVGAGEIRAMQLREQIVRRMTIITLCRDSEE